MNNTNRRPQAAWMTARTFSARQDALAASRQAKPDSRTDRAITTCAHRALAASPVNSEGASARMRFIANHRREHGCGLTA